MSESLVAKMPARLDCVPAAGLPLAGLTALQVLRDELGVARGTGCTSPAGPAAWA